MNQTMTRLQKMTESEHSTLMRVLFGQSSAATVQLRDMKKDLDWMDPSLNDSQKEAIMFSLGSREDQSQSPGVGWWAAVRSAV